MVSGDEVASPQLGRHVIRVGAYSAAIYREWAVDHGVPALTVTRWALLLRRAAMQHDIGKAGVPADILNKRGRLTREEQRVMRSHCQYGALLCAGQHTPWARLGAEVALNHHERWDGSGYAGLDGSGRRANGGPRSGKRGTQIPLSARIVGLADVYDALRMPRPYKQAWEEQRVIDYLRQEAGRLFDPQVVAAFGRAYRTFDAEVRATPHAADGRDAPYIDTPVAPRDIWKSTLPMRSAAGL